MNKTIYVFGNEMLSFDSSAVEVAKSIEKEFDNVKFVYTDPTEDFPPKGERNIIVLDTVKGINSPKIFFYSDVEQWDKSPISVHDYDLILHLGLLNKTGVIDNVTIIGVPMRLKKNMIKKIKNFILSI